MIVETTEEIDLYGKPAPAGTRVERPDAFWLIGLGVAKPIDEEAKAKAKEFAEQKERVRAKIERQAAERLRIHEETQATIAAVEEKERHAAFEQFLKEGPDESA